MASLFIEIEGTIGEPIAPKSWTEHLFCYKAHPGIDDMYGFDGDVFLTQLNWEREWRAGNVVDAPKITLRESAADPIVDIPVRKITGMVYGEGSRR